MDIPESAAWTLKDLNSLTRLRMHRHDYIFLSSHDLQSQVTPGRMSLLLVRLYPSISFCFSSKLQMTTPLHALPLKCTYFPLSEPIPILTSHHHNQPTPSPSKPNE